MTCIRSRRNRNRTVLNRRSSRHAQRWRRVDDQADEAGEAQLVLFLKHGEGHVGRAFDDAQQGARRTARLALALLPVAHGLDRHTDAGG